MRVSELFRSFTRLSSSRVSKNRRRKSVSPASAEVLEVRQLLVAQITQLGDLNVVAEPGPSDPQELTQIGNTLFFTASDKTHGRELWKKEGANAAVLVRDIFVGTANSDIAELTAVGSTLFFRADDGHRGSELWKSDGTAAGTVLVRDYWYDSSDSSTANMGCGPAELTNVNGKLFFRANPDVNVVSPYLMSSDGTADGTGPVRTNVLLPLPWNFGSQITAVGSNVYFLGAASGPGGAGGELWKSDGTPAGTVMVADVWPGTGQSLPTEITPVGNTVYFTAWTANGSVGSHNRELWKTDGTPEGTSLVKDINAGDNSSDPRYLTNVNGSLFFSADDGVAGRELWKSDGTAAGTVRVKDILPGSSGSGPANLTAVDGTVYFSASDGVSGDELWKSDGTSAGTVLVGHSGTASNFTPRNLTNVGGALYFSAFTFENGFELWKSNGTTAGTNVFKDLNPGAASSAPQRLLNLNGTLFYTADDGAKGRELWRHDVGTNSAVRDDIFRGTLNSSARNFTEVSGTIYFVADNGVNGAELWKCSSTGTGAVMVKDIYPGINESSITNLTNVNGMLYFSAVDDVNGAELWKSNGTTAGTVLVKDIYASTSSSYPSRLTNLNGTLLFTAGDTNGTELWKSDGTSAGTVLVKDIAAGATGSMERFGIPFAVRGTTAYFAAFDSDAGAELWKTDGTTAGTVRVKDIFTGPTGSLPENLTVVGDRLYFDANNGTSGRELWQSDGTAAGTVLAADLNPGASGSVFKNFANADGKLFFESYNANGLWDLFCRATPTSAVVGMSLLQPTGHLRYIESPLTPVGSSVYFTHLDYNTGEELWKSDGTSAGTVMVKDIVPLPKSSQNGSTWGSSPQQLVNNNGVLYFTAHDRINGRELWMSDGTSAGTVMLADLTSDSGSSSPENLTAINGRVFMTAMSESFGREPVSVIDVVVPQPPVITAPTGTTALQRPVITWTTSNGAVSYDVFIKNNATGANPQISTSVSGTSYTPTADMGIGDFSVWVRAVNAAGTKSSWSGVRNFMINTPVSTAPMIRQQTTSSPEVVWKDLPGAVRHDVWLDSTTAGQISSVNQHNVTGKSWRPANDLPLGQYRAWVRGLDASGLAAAWSSVVFFNVATSPTLTSPNGSSIDNRPQFSWSAVSSATKYEVYVKNLDTESQYALVRDITATSWTPSANMPPGHYLWQAIAVTANYRGLWSAPVRFTIGGQPEMIGPVGPGTNTTPAFTWNAVGGAATYQLWVDRSDTYVQGIINISGLTGTSYTPTTALPVGSFRVWIRAVSSSGQLTDWSQSLAFSLA